MKIDGVKGRSVYDFLSERMAGGKTPAKSSGAIRLDQRIRGLRIQKKLTGAELCRRAGDLNPKTLAAVEAGRIKNPSIKTLLAISTGLGVMVSDLFEQREEAFNELLYAGSQKGAFQMEFPKWGIKIVSFTPFIKDFFCGKWIFAPRRKVDQTLLRHPLPFFVSVLIGRFEITLRGKVYDLKEGDNLFFNGMLKHSFYNSLHRESVLMLVTAPSFL